jgi:hypothetical protein
VSDVSNDLLNYYQHIDSTLFYPSDEIALARHKKEVEMANLRRKKLDTTDSALETDLSKRKMN